MEKILYFWVQVVKTVIFIISIILMFLIIVFVLMVLLIFHCLIGVKKFMTNKCFPSKEFANKQQFYQAMYISRTDYRQEQFVESCIQERIDPYIARIFWNACGTYHFLKKFPYKPNLEDQMVLLDQGSLYLALSTTMKMSGASVEINYDEIKDIKELLKLINHNAKENHN
jgi:hypothetical protein